MRPTLTTAVLAVALLALAGCGDDKPGRPANLAQARAVVEKFAAADDATACKYLGTKALKDVYGNFTDPYEQARANCEKASRKFKGEPVTIIKTSFIEDTGFAKVVAHSADGEFSYSVNLKRKPHRPWRIYSINQARLR